MADSGDGGARGGGVRAERKIAVKPFTLPRCTSSVEGHVCANACMVASV